MKLTKISRAIAGLCAVAAAPAFALPASDYTNASEFVGDTVNYRISGATAVDPGIIAATMRLCTTSSIHRYSSSNQAVVFCTGNGTVGLPAGATKIAVYKHSPGGSGNGVGPVNSGATLPFLDLVKVAASCLGSSSVGDLDGTGPLPTFVDVQCSTTAALTTATVTYIGVSDVEPDFFGGPSTYNNLKFEPLATVIFGVPVTKNVYEALQVEQGLGTCAGALTEACMPSLSQGQITSMYTQEGQTWSGLTGIPAATTTDDLIYFARRASTSGTQKTTEAVIARTINSISTGKSCQPAVDGFVSGPNAADNTAANTLCNGGNLVVNNSGSNQVLTCMNKHQADGRGAVGVLSTEYKSSVGGSVRFVKVSDHSPTYAGVASGKYTQYSDASLNTRIGSNLPTASARGYANFLTEFKKQFADPANIEVVNGAPQPFGPSGLMALDQLASPIPAPDFAGTTARNPWSRAVGGVTLNNCQPGKLASF